MFKFVLHNFRYISGNMEEYSLVVVNYAATLLLCYHFVRNQE